MKRIASHRGGTLEFGDSTPQGFAATAQLPVDEVEFDLHPTADGAIIVHHDPTLDRTTDTQGAIAELPEATVRAAVIDYGSGGHPLTLAELCAVYRNSPVDFRCEFKPDAAGRPYADFIPGVLDVLAQERMLARTTFSSFLIETQDELARLTNRPRLWLVSPPVLRQLGDAGVIELALAHGIPEISVQIDYADGALMARVREAGLAFGCFGAHTAAQIDKALALGVKVFTSDRPSLALARRAAFDKGQRA
ncbi:glycerophosphoryl diester phosphodiesterase [Primorskyibacter sedentarius]|uniref:Glycerophosphoryl diester phosphodiesterase n=1 Tax=Primorskyibacter sedentarius TaxID=745311 RepID=A0A4R3IQY3_9RHOB|nr:glycerophosphodiester phosphodiesterase family protein [Primorskyibacter sedentarius]TCS51602.1 glycerophosphoryl diester phosphodiesterase [Primorskyibacter sedentarius]